jgi:hypothetical protein
VNGPLDALLVLVDDVTEEDRIDLVRVREYTVQMRTSEQQVIDVAKQRRRLLRSLRERNVPFRVLAEATGTTEQAIYKDIRWGKD